MMATQNTTITRRRRAARIVLVVAATLAGLGLSTASASAIEFLSLGASVKDLSGQATRQAGSHPDVQFKFVVPARDSSDPTSFPLEQPHRLQLDLPVGLVGNPTAADTCAVSQMKGGPNGNTAKCPIGAQVGVATVFSGNATGDTTGVTQPVPVYNVERPAGTPGLFAFTYLGVVIKIAPTVRAGDYGITLDSGTISQGLVINGADVTLWGVPGDPAHDTMRSPDGGTPLFCFMETCYGTGVALSSPPKPFISMPTSCPGKADVTTVRLDGWNTIGRFTTQTFNSDFEGVPFVNTGCEKLPFVPGMDVKSTSRRADAPTGLKVDLTVPQGDSPNGLATGHVKDVSVALPAGMSVSPSSANGLGACSDAQVGLKSDDPAQCSDASKLGTVTVDTPLLKDPLQGNVYLGTQESDDPMSGKMFRIFLVASGSGVTIKLEGGVKADPTTGQLTATFKNNPQLPFSALHVKFFGGQGAPLATPAACGSYATGTEISSWSGKVASLQSGLHVNCRPGLGWFGPYFSAGTINPAAGGSSPFVLRVNKPDGQSALNGLSMVLPEGLLANLKGNVGRRIGTARVAAGPGSSPFWLSGPVVLEGPYGGAPFSLRVTVPAIAGPFNLGDVVVRQKLFVDPHDAHVTAVSDPLPTIVKGVPVRLQNLAVDIDKAGFMRSPTSCAPKSIAATLGAATGQTAAVASRFQVGDCANLPLKPKMKMDLIGKKETKRGKHPALSTTLTQQPGESGLRKVKVRLPLSLALDPDNAQALCKPEQAAAKACPKGSIVGHATAITPLLNQPLKGDVFFVEGTRKSKTGRVIKTLPKLWVALRGEVALDIWADSAIGDGKYLETTFGFIPDAPIESFKLDIDGGKHGILAVTGDSDANLCKQSNVTKATYDGQSGKQVKSSVRMTSPCGFQVADKSLSNTHAKVTVAGIGAGKLSISGKGIHKASRTIKRASTATIKPRLTDAGERAAKRGKALRLRVTWNPKKKGKKTRHARATVKQAKKATR